ncbi:SDR family NAD(P)-dependent oxidoreductase [Methylobacterium sp. GC_Met_2]|uniref:SDR family NAD(P)-dependent oxidoreductase n=1 Tax=Methylobacterium sp. GC_Met_2 TaxID=2937376 RepID=UPI00226B4484|nr:SDR family NAD(P)-dependent oxidoreductase [Methylobacterium sp. GC_Met_2]
MKIERTTRRPAVVIVTGASSGLSKATALLFARRGWSVSLIARGINGLRATQDEIRRHRDRDALERAAASVEAELGEMDGWVNVAGSGTYAFFDEGSADDFDRVLLTNLTGSINGTRIASRRMVPRDRGTVVQVGSASRYLYWTQKGPSNGGVGCIMRLSLDLGPGDDPADRADVEVLLDALPEPIDLMFDDRIDTLYWTDRGRAPRGNILNAARVGAAGLTEHRILMIGLWEGIGVCANARRDTLWVTDLLLGHVRRFDFASGKDRTIRRGRPRVRGPVLDDRPDGAHQGTRRQHRLRRLGTGPGEPAALGPHRRPFRRLGPRRPAVPRAREGGEPAGGSRSAGRQRHCKDPPRWRMLNHAACRPSLPNWCHSRAVPRWPCG